jgi:hypothetical protein
MGVVCQCRTVRKDADVANSPEQARYTSHLDVQLGGCGELNRRSIEHAVSLGVDTLGDGD